MVRNEICNEEQKVYSHKKKEKLANKVSKIKRKKDLVNIFKIINGENDNVTENNNGLFLFFHNLQYETYIKLENYLNHMNNSSNSDNNSDNNNSYSDELSFKKEYKPYSIDEFPSQRNFSPKLKYSNKEKNLIKRQRYDDNINNENNNNNNNNSNNSITYCDFNVSNLTDSENKN
jgi:hypothetical protein